MSEEITRKGFLAAAVAAGAAALVPAAAFADEASVSTEVTPLSALNVESVQDSGALAGSEWAEAAAATPIDVTKSYSGIHIMNEPGYFAFSGWNTTYDQPTDLGFGFTRDRFFVKGKVDLWGTMYSNGAPFEDWITSMTSVDGWECEVWKSGRKVARRSVDYDGLSMTTPYGNGFYENVDATLPSGFFSSISNIQGQIWSGFGILWWSLASFDTRSITGYAASMSSLTSNVTIFYEVRGE